MVEGPVLLPLEKITFQDLVAVDPCNKLGFFGGVSGNTIISQTVKV